MKLPVTLEKGFADWGMSSYHRIVDADKQVVVYIPFVQPYCMGATAKEIEAAQRAEKLAESITLGLNGRLFE